MTGWVNEQEARGTTQPNEAIKSAFSHEPTGYIPTYRRRLFFNSRTPRRATC